MAAFARGTAAPPAASYQSIATPYSVSTVNQIHKREAEAEADPSLLYTPNAYAYTPYAYAYAPYARVAAHPGLATSYTYRNPQGHSARYKTWQV